MPSPKNIQAVKTLIEKISKAKSVVLADYSGLNVNLQQVLRRKIKEVQGELIVVKNSILKIAATQEKYPINDLIDSFSGPNITLLAYEDEIAPIKVLAEFAKENSLPKIKIGFLNKKALTKEQIETLAKLPSRIELLTKTVGTIKAPITGFINVLSGNLHNLVFALKAIQLKKGGE